jgi:hypothetical protein
MAAEVISMRGSTQAEDRACALPLFLKKEETAAQIVALMQARFSRPEPQEMLEILKCAEMQVTGLLP